MRTERDGKNGKGEEKNRKDLPAGRMMMVSQKVTKAAFLVIGEGPVLSRLPTPLDPGLHFLQVIDMTNSQKPELTTGSGESLLGV
jgi:hypothetical protein